MVSESSVLLLGMLDRLLSTQPTPAAYMPPGWLAGGGVGRGGGWKWHVLGPQLASQAQPPHVCQRPGLDNDGAVFTPASGSGGIH